MSPSFHPTFALPRLHPPPPSLSPQKGLSVAPDFLGLALAVALAGLVFLEMVRLNRVPLLHSVVAPFMESFQDCQDASDLLLTHIYLLLACAVPLWLDANLHPTQPSLRALAGILSIGVGDAAAAVIGSQFVVTGRCGFFSHHHHQPDCSSPLPSLSTTASFGRAKWPGLHKSLVGTAAAFAAQAAALAVLCASPWYPGASGAPLWWRALPALAAGALLEALTTSIDNFSVPLVVFALLPPLPSH